MKLKNIFLLICNCMKRLPSLIALLMSCHVEIEITVFSFIVNTGFKYEPKIFINLECKNDQI